MPDPLGPMSPTVSPAATSSDMSCKMSTRPAFPIKESEALDSDKTGSDMWAPARLFGALAYGARITVLNAALLVFGAGAVQAEVVVAALGDSLTAGYGLDTADGLVPQLQGWLDAQGADVRLINAGLSGDTTAGGLSRVDWTLTDDVDAMIVALGANDYLRGLPPAVARENLSGILSAADAKGVKVLLVGLEVGSNYGADYKSEFDAIYTGLSAEFDVPLIASIFDPLIAATGSQDAMTALLQPDGLHPTAKGVAIIVDGIGPDVMALIDSID